MCARSAAGRRWRGWSPWRKGASNLPAQCLQRVTLRSVARARGDALQIDGWHELGAHGLLQLGRQIQGLDLGLQARHDKGEGGEQLGRDPLGLGQMLAGTRGQIDRRGEALQLLPERLKTGGHGRDRLCLSAGEIIGVIELAERADQLTGLRLMRLRLLVLDLGRGHRRQRRLAARGERRRAPARVRALRAIGLFGRPRLLPRRLGGGHARFCLPDLAGQIQAGGLAHLMLDMEKIRRMLGLAIVGVMAAQGLRLVAGALHHLHRQPLQGVTSHVLLGRTSRPI